MSGTISFAIVEANVKECFQKLVVSKERYTRMTGGTIKKA